MQQWEYTTFWHTGSLTDHNRLQEFGAKGWEAYSIDKKNILGHIDYFLKRPKQSQKDGE